MSWSKILFQLEIQYSNIDQLTPTQYQLNPIHSNCIFNWNELAILVRVVLLHIFTVIFSIVFSTYKAPRWIPINRQEEK